MIATISNIPNKNVKKLDLEEDLEERISSTNDNSRSELSTNSQQMGGCSSAQVVPEEVAGEQHRKTNWCLCCVRRRASSSAKLLSNKTNGNGNTKPSVEEIKSWKHDFHALLDSKYGVNQFQEFLRSQYGEENLCFWLAVEEYKNMTDKESRRDMARMIYEDYVSTLSPTEISLDAKVRATIDKNMSDPDENAFQPAQEHIYTLMYHDCFPRFIKSKAYKQLTRTC